jgi:aspartyl protease family protein
MRALHCGVALVLAGLLPGVAGAQSVALQGMLGSRALLMVDGGVPTGVAAGEVHRGVKVISTGGDTAVVEIAGKRLTLRLGESPASVGGSGNTGRGRIVLTASSGGHFVSLGSINGQTVQFMVDTGATAVGLSVSEAERIGLNYRAGQPVRMSTANGIAQGWRTRLNTVRLGAVEIHDVEAVVTPQGMPYVLLGNSYLSRFQMQRDNDQMTLERRY